MTKSKKVALSTFAAFVLAACTVATLGMANGVSAMAAEEEPKPVPAAQGWYIVGNGAGTLSKCDWNNYVPEFKFEGEEAKEGTFTYKNVTLYEGDAFKVLYANGEWAWPSESGWGADVMAQFSNLATNADGYFVNGGLGNIQATKAGQGVYDFTLTVTATETTLSYKQTSKDVDEIAKEEMYVVGNLAAYPDCNWPGAIDVKTCCPALTLDTTTNKWKADLFLMEGDTFKVYNLVNNAYFPSGVANDCVIEVAGMYTVEYEVAAPSFTVKNSAGEIVYGE